MTATDYEFQFFLIQLLFQSEIGFLNKKDIIQELNKKDIFYNYNSFKIKNNLEGTPYSFIHFLDKMIPPCAKYIVTIGYTNKNIYTLEVGDNNDYFICMLNGRKHFVVEHINHKISEEDFLKKIKNIH